MSNLVPLKKSGNAPINEYVVTAPVSGEVEKFTKGLGKRIKKQFSTQAGSLKNGIKISSLLTAHTNTVELLVNKGLKRYVSNSGDAIAFNIKLEHLPTQVAYLWSYYCGMLGLLPVRNVAQSYFDSDNLHKFTLSTKAIKLNYESPDGQLHNVIGITLGHGEDESNKYVVPVKPSVVDTEDGDITYEYHVNGNSVELISSPIAEDDLDRGYYYQLMIFDRFNTVNYIVSISLMDSVTDPEMALDLWQSGYLVDYIKQSGQVSMTYKKAFDHIFKMGVFPDTGVWLGLSEGVDTDYANNTKWAVTVPEQFSELPVYDEYRSEMTKLGNLTHIYLPKSMDNMVRPHISGDGKTASDARLILVVYGKGKWAKASPQGQIVVDPNPMIIRASMAENPDFKDFVTSFEPCSSAFDDISNELDDDMKALTGFISEFDDVPF